MQATRLPQQQIASLHPHSVFVGNECSTGPSRVNLREFSAKEQDLR